MALGNSTALSIVSPSLLDVAKLTDPSGKIMPVVQALQQRNTFIQSMSWKVGNMDTGHMVAAQNSLPSVTWVRLNEGVAPSKGSEDTYTEHCGMLEGLSSIDTRVADMNGNAVGYRAAKDTAFLSQMANTLESAFFYETTAANPERILGLAPRLGLTTSKYGNQIIKADAGAAGANQSSMFLIGWGDQTVYGISPRGQATGLQMKDKGEQRVLDSKNNVLWKYETRFQWNCGLCVEDYRFVVRIANIDVTRLVANFSAGADLVASMIAAYYQIFDPNSAKLAFYCDRRIGAMLHQQALNHTTNSSLSVDPAPSLGAPGVFGKPLVRCLGAPIYVSDAIVNNEALVS